MAPQKYWLSCRAWTVQVTVEDDIVVEAAPIVRKFVGQRFANLVRWAEKLGGMRVELLWWN